MSFIGSSNKQLSQIFILIPKGEFIKVESFKGEKIKAIIKDLINDNEITIITQIIKQGSNYLLSIYSKYHNDFEKFIGHDLKVTLEKI
jgi:hypothetical protein